MMNAECNGRFSILETEFKNIGTVLQEIKNIAENAATKKDIEKIGDEIEVHKKRIGKLEAWRTWILGAVALFIYLNAIGAIEFFKSKIT